MSIKKYTSVINRPVGWFKKTSRRNKIIVSILGFIFLLVIFQSIANANKKPQYTMAKVQVSDVTEIVTDTGTITTTGRSDVFSPTNGVIEELYINNNYQVEKGEDLFKVLSDATEAEKASAYANYQTAVNSLTTAQQTKQTYQAALESSRQAILDTQNAVNYKNENTRNPATGKDYTELEKQSLDSSLTSARQTFTANETKYKQADVAIAAAQAQVNSTWLAYEATQSTVVKAPVSGTVVNLAVGQGGAVKAEALSGTVTPVLAVINLSTTEITVQLNELDAGKIKPGQEVKIEADSISDKTYKGSVTRIDEVGTVNQGVIQYNAYITLHNPDNRIRSGMTVDVDIVTKKVSDVLTVPNAAVKPYKGGRAVRVIDPKTNELVFKPVEIGIKGDSKTQILKGISEGEEVVTALPNDQVKRPGLF